VKVAPLGIEFTNGTDPYGVSPIFALDEDEQRCSLAGTANRDIYFTLSIWAINPLSHLD
jgi:hypothetical protein